MKHVLAAVAIAFMALVTTSTAEAGRVGVYIGGGGVSVTVVPRSRYYGPYYNPYYGPYYGGGYYVAPRYRHRHYRHRHYHRHYGRGKKYR